MTDVAELLERAAEQVAKGWCQGHGAEDARGYSTRTDSPSAIRWCAIGAIDLHGVYPEVEQARQALCAVIGESSVAIWNDRAGRTQAEVVAALRQAAERARQAA